MTKKLDDKNFEGFIKDSFYSTVGFYAPSVENQDKMIEVIEQFSKTHGSVSCGIMDITGQNIPDEYGIGEDETPIVVVFKQGNPFKAITDISIENIANAITPPGKNITLQ
ncbi:MULTISPECIES: hypothetical protein [Clostridium]|uniref:Uncharacterized protein n=1 Tax=Clostridium ragsdalei P11 TaxID=1353534 RepID=A0A1A6AM18_9CLOT|nr:MULTISPECIES: hypothetical protein [Clostridium]OBR91096.1 hypothetical protein CLRAG_32280 [Clostridium ragsdalei P11]QXE18437.1 hypothetical protein B5S50_06045 [Clostridium sp. 001]